MSAAGDALFIVCAVFAIAGAVGTVMQRSALRAAMALLVNIISIAGLFLTLQAHLLAALQLLVYAGAVVVLFVFTIMLIGSSADHATGDRGVLVRTLSLGLMGIVTAGIAFALVRVSSPWVAVPTCEAGAACGDFGSVEGLGRAVYVEGMVPFELVSVLLLVAVVGAIAVARGRSAAEVEEARARPAEQRAEETRRRDEAERLSAEAAAHGGP